MSVQQHHPTSLLRCASRNQTKDVEETLSYDNDVKVINFVNGWKWKKMAKNAEIKKKYVKREKSLFFMQEKKRRKFVYLLSVLIWKEVKKKKIESIDESILIALKT